MDLVFCPHSGSSGNGLMVFGAALSRALSKSDSSSSLANLLSLFGRMTWARGQQTLFGLQKKKQKKNDLLKLLSLIFLQIVNTISMYIAWGHEE